MSNSEDDDALQRQAVFTTGVAYPQQFAGFAIALAKSATRYVDILSPQLDQAAFGNEALSSSLSALARSSRQTRVRILLQDPRPIVARGHRLLQLARRLPSTVHIQVLQEHPLWTGQTIVIRDRDGVLYRPADGDNTGFYEPDSRASTQRHLELFEELWRYSVQDSQLRTLHI